MLARNPEEKSEPRIGVQTQKLVRYQWLDITRGVLIALIVIQHVYWFSSGKEYWWGRAQLAVNAFVVLSGFVLMMSIRRRQENYWPFLHRRLAKLLGAYLACFFLALVIRPLIVGKHSFEAARELSETQYYWAHIGAHLSLLYGLVPNGWLPNGNDAFLPPAWFTSLMVQFYLVAPLLGRLSEKWLWRLLGLSLIVLLHPINWRLLVYWSPYGAALPMKLYLFLSGMLLYTYWPALGSGKAPFWCMPVIKLGNASYWIYLLNYPVLSLVF